MDEFYEIDDYCDLKEERAEEPFIENWNLVKIKDFNPFSFCLGSKRTNWVSTFSLEWTIGSPAPWDTFIVPPFVFTTNKLRALENKLTKFSPRVLLNTNLAELVSTYNLNIKSNNFINSQLFSRKELIVYNEWNEDIELEQEPMFIELPGYLFRRYLDVLQKQFYVYGRNGFYKLNREEDESLYFDNDATYTWFLILRDPLASVGYEVDYGPDEWERRYWDWD